MESVAHAPTYLWYRLLPGRVTACPHGRHAHAVVPVTQGHYVPVSCVSSRHRHGHVVCLGSRVDKVHTLFRERREEDVKTKLGR